MRLVTRNRLADLFPACLPPGGPSARRGGIFVLFLLCPQHLERSWKQSRDSGQGGWMRNKEEKREAQEGEVTCPRSQNCILRDGVLTLPTSGRTSPPAEAFGLFQIIAATSEPPGLSAPGSSLSAMHFTWTCFVNNDKARTLHD